MEDGVGQGEDRSCAAIVVFEFVEPHVGEGVLKLQHVFRVGTAKAIDTLGVVTDDQISALLAKVPSRSLIISDWSLVVSWYSSTRMA